MPTSSSVSFALIVGLLAVASRAQAEDTTSANYLLDECEKYIRDKENATGHFDAFGTGVCLGAVTATFQIMYLHNDFCPPKTVTVGQGLRVAVKYMEDHPADLHYAYADEIFIALHEAWPCAAAK